MEGTKDGIARETGGNTEGREGMRERGGGSNTIGKKRKRRTKEDKMKGKHQEKGSENGGGVEIMEPLRKEGGEESKTK